MTTEELYVNNERLALAFLRRYMPLLLGDEDALQTAKCGLWKACLSYVPQRGVALSTWAFAVIRNELYRQHRQQKKSVLCTASLDAPVYEDVLLGDTVASDFDIESEVSESILINLIDRLAKRERLIVLARLEGKSQKEIARTLGIGQPQVSRALKRIKEQFAMEV